VSDTLTGVVLDTAAVLGWTRQHPYPQTHVWSMSRLGGTIVVPAAVLAAAHAVIAEQNRDIIEALLALPNTMVPTLDRATAAKLGTLLRKSDDHADALVSAAHAVAEATARDCYVLTDRAETLTSLHPNVLVDTLP